MSRFHGPSLAAVRGMAVARTVRMRTTALASSLLTASVLSASLLSGCAGSDEAGDPEDSMFVDDSKADDFFSTSAAEYILEGKSTVVLDATMAGATAEAKLAAAKQLVSYKQIAIAWFVTQYLVSKEHDAPN